MGDKLAVRVFLTAAEEIHDRVRNGRITPEAGYYKLRRETFFLRGALAAELADPDLLKFNAFLESFGGKGGADEPD